MNKEIKAILEFLDDNLWVKYENTYQKSLTDKECKLLLNYITNLQEELENLREEDWAWHQVLKMQNAREYRSKFLKDFQKEYNTHTYPDYDEIYKRYDKLQKEVDKLTAESTEWEERTYCWQDRAEDLEIRIDRAIKYICDYSKSLDERTIIDILKGEDK